MGASVGALAGEAALGARLGDIGDELRAWRLLWSGHAFRSLRLAWEDAHPALAAALRGLDADAAEALHLDPDAADRFLGRWLPVERWRGLEEVPPFEAASVAPWPRDAERDVPGRKWAQVESFVGVLSPAPGARLLDWCAGKGHLGRALSLRFGARPVVALEREAPLVEEAVRLARRAGARLEVHRCDVLHEAAAVWIDRDTHACALHACGHLHLRLLELATHQRAAALSLAPCCYHLAGERGAGPLSVAGRAAWPGLALADLRTAVQETVTADAHVRRRRRQLQTWQLGFDALARELRGVDEYLPLPSVDTALLRGDFAGFCRVLAGRKGLGLPAAADWEAWERRGRQRFAEVSALDLVRQRFRRLLELWLVLDRAMLLQEAGYVTCVGAFCARQLSPRNLLLQARRAD